MERDPSSDTDAERSQVLDALWGAWLWAALFVGLALAGIAVYSSFLAVSNRGADLFRAVDYPNPTVSLTAIAVAALVGALVGAIRWWRL